MPGNDVLTHFLTENPLNTLNRRPRCELIGRKCSYSDRRSRKMTQPPIRWQIITLATIGSTDDVVPHTIPLPRGNIN